MNEPTPTGPEDDIPAADVAAMAPTPPAADSPSDPVFQPRAPQSAIAGFGEKLRGFEIVGTNPWDGSERLYAKFRPTELAARQAAADLRWLQWRHPELKYEMRALLSIGREPPPAPPAEEGPLRLDADEAPSAESDPAAE